MLAIVANILGIVAAIVNTVAAVISIKKALDKKERHQKSNHVTLPSSVANLIQ